MSKNVAIFLVLFVLVAGGALFALKNNSTLLAPPAAETAATAPASTDAIAKADAATEPAAGEADDATATKGDDAKDKAADTSDKTDSAATENKADAPAADAATATDDKKADAEPATGSGSPVAAAPTGGATGSSLLAPSSSLDVDMTNALAERDLGDKDAPVTIIEYASMTCPHCARFSNNIFPDFKKTFIDTGKVYYIYRDYPLDTIALKAGMMARCADRSKYFDLVEVIFKNQERWIKSSDPVAGLKQLGALAGMDDAYINACMGNAELQTELLRRMQDATNKYKVNATPTFVFNNGAEFLSGDQTLEDFQKVIDKLPKKGK
ncbi:MAG: DsbA family protein [Micavibrio sp.]|nr:DsbA family protein [Micavibrio sp.]